jgi:hypothetical protein
MGALGFVWLMIKRRRFFAWVVMLAILLAFFLIFSRLPPTVLSTTGQEPMMGSFTTFRNQSI